MIKFTKMHGIGNDFPMINGFSQTFSDADLPELARKLCDRRFGVGGDGLIFAFPGVETQFAMRMFNPDGSESEMCGNGIRCFAQFVQDQGLTSDSVIPVETGAGRLTLHVLEDRRVRVDMGIARLKRGEIGMTGPADEKFIGEQVSAGGHTFFSGTAVSMGNPHLVIPVEDASAIDLKDVGPAFEHHPDFPARVNVHFIQVLGRGELIQRTWERGAGITLACGTGACSCAVAAYELGLTDRSVLIHLPGGDLEIEYQEDGRVFMTGPAATVFDGVWN